MAGRTATRRNLPQFLFTYIGILKAGLVMVPINPLLRAGEVAYHLEDSDAKVLVTFETFAPESVKGAAEVEGVTTYVVNLPGSDQRPEGTRHYDELYVAEDSGEIVPTSADETAVLLYTSGGARSPVPPCSPDRRWRSASRWGSSGR